eukprot:scaffold189296_cov36-Tisochrysis_lutea.AAC.2
MAMPTTATYQWPRIASAFGIPNDAAQISRCCSRIDGSIESKQIGLKSQISIHGPMAAVM